MKYTISFFCLFFCLFLAKGQSIMSFSINPANPISTDTIYIYAGLRFSSGTCELDNLSHAVSGFDIQASTHHCVGVLTVICNVTDTFKINPLPVGDYNFNLNLTSGGAPAPCTAGIVPDDDSTFSFTVGPSGPAGIKNQSSSAFTIYPNPVHDQINLSAVPDGTDYAIISISGQVVKSGVIKSNTINNLETLSTGMYFLKLETLNGGLVRQIIKE